jgi:hypothetical protein
VWRDGLAESSAFSPALRDGAPFVLPRQAGAVSAGVVLSIAKVRPGNGWRYYFRGVAVGDGRRPASMPLKAAQEDAGVPPGTWVGRGLPALGLVAGAVVSERQAELLFGEGRHPDADAMEAELLAAGESPAAALRATVLGRPVDDIANPVVAVDLVFRGPPSFHALCALVDDATLAVLEECQTVARDRTIGWLEDDVAEVRWGSGGRHHAGAQLVVAVFRHYDNRLGSPLLHDHALISLKVARPDGKFGNLDTRRLFQHVVAAGTLYSLLLAEEVTERLGLAWEPREVTEGLRPVMEIAGIPHELIAWQGTRSREIRDYYDGLADWYATEHGHPPGERASYGLARWAAEETRPPKVLRPLPLLRETWRADAVRRFGEQLVDGLLRLARAAAAVILARVRAVVDVALAAVDVAATVYVMRGSFARRHLLAESRRHLAQTLRGRRHEGGLDEQIVDQALTEHCTRAGRDTWIADWTGLYPAGAEVAGAAVRPSARRRQATQYQRAQTAAVVLRRRLRASRRARRPSTRPAPAAVAQSGRAASPLSPRRAQRPPGRAVRQATDLATLQASERRIAEIAARTQAAVAVIHEGNAAALRMPRPVPAPPALPTTPLGGPHPRPGRTAS